MKKVLRTGVLVLMQAGCNWLDCIGPAAGFILEACIVL